MRNLFQIFLINSDFRLNVIILSKFITLNILRLWMPSRIWISDSEKKYLRSGIWVCIVTEQTCVLWKGFRVCYSLTDMFRISLFKVFVVSRLFLLIFLLYIYIYTNHDYSLSFVDLFYIFFSIAYHWKIVWNWIFHWIH